MDLENQLDSHTESTSTSTSTPAPTTAPVPEASRGSGDEIPGISEHSSFNLPAFLYWLCAVFAIVATVTFWFLNSSAAAKLADKKDEKTSTIAEISSPTYASVEAKATAFQSAVNQLKAAEKDRYPMNEFLPLFYARINKNVVVTNLSVGSDGKISFDGTTNSYKSAAEQLASIQNWKINDKNVVVNAQLLSESEDVSKGVVVKFAISGNVDKTVSLKTITTDTTNTTQGGN